jgi:hypothetical protein
MPKIGIANPGSAQADSGHSILRIQSDMATQVVDPLYVHGRGTGGSQADQKTQ